MFLFVNLIIIFFITILAELNRTPFDLSEGESELVSGFNVDYIRGLFGIIFISEYDPYSTDCCRNFSETFQNFFILSYSTCKSSETSLKYVT